MAGFGWNVLGGVFAAFAYALILWWRRRERNLDDFGRLAGKYRVTQKWSEEPQGTVTLSGNGPKLDFVWTMEDGSAPTGKLWMNEQTRLTGAGSYQHRRTGFGWGELTVQVADRERGAVRLLVDRQFTDPTAHQPVAEAWVWEMHHASNPSDRWWRAARSWIG